MSFETDREDESRNLLIAAFWFALGTYVEQEAKKNDQWRDQNVGQLYAHLAHEVDEIKTNIQRGQGRYLIHNAADAVGLSLMLLAKALEQGSKQ
jgi:hypothetical protein